MLADKTSDVYIRTAWANAEVALAQLNKGKAEGSRTAIWVRSRIQAELFHLGCLIYCHPGKVIFVAFLLLASFCVGLKSAIFHSKIEQLWIEEGGNVEKELRYRTAAVGDSGSSIDQIVIQTTKEPDGSILHPGPLLKHAEVLKAAISLTVDLFDVTWGLKDLCYAPSISNFEAHFVDQIFEDVIPCAIVTPLDCFWEGSKLLGPYYPVNIPGLGSKVHWTNLNPQTLLETMKTFEIGFPYDTLEKQMKRAGITTGYQEKPCLNPHDEDCPMSARNKKSKQPPNVGVELAGGCYGFAAKYMHWPEELILGGIKRNASGHIVRANALQSVIQLMGDKELHDFWVDTYKVHNIDWSPEKAALVLETWQRMFSQEIHSLMGKGNNTSPYNMYAFSSATLNIILTKFSQINFNKIAIGYVSMLLYAAVSLLRWNDPVKSHCALGVAGVILVTVSVAAGLGFCAVLGIAFNASTTEIVPFLALGLGVDDIFFLTHAYAEQAGNNSSTEEETGLLLKKTGLSILLTSLSNMCAMFAAALIPIPALRVFSLQSAVLVLFNLASALLVFPAIVSLDLRRRGSGRYDMLCCCLPPPEFTGPSVKKGANCKLQSITRALPPDRLQTVTVLAPPKIHGKANANREKEPVTLNKEVGLCELLFEGSLSMTSFASSYANFISRPEMKIISTLLFIFILAGSVWGMLRVTDGLDLKDIVPQGTNEHKFLNAQAKYFGFYNMYAVSQGDFDYPNNQRLLYEYHEGFMRVQSIVKNDDGGLPPFWLGMFRDWLTELQVAFDRDWKNGKITQEKWFSNSSDEGILAYKLLVQTGRVDNPIDKSLITHHKLVDSDGIINPKGFYNYLSAWASNDALAYGASAANLFPTPREWYHVASDFDLKIPKSTPLIYTQLPFYLHDLKDTVSITKAITQVREVCKKFEDRGLPNFPSGIPFLFWEQYIHLRQSLGLAILCALASIFIVVSVVLVNIRTAALIVLMIAGMILQLLGIMGIFGIKLSAIPAVLLIISVGIGVHFTANLCLSFVTSIGNRQRRAKMAVEHMFSPIVSGALTMLLALIMLGFSEFEFIVKYFFYVLLSLIGVGVVNGLVFLPTLLSLVGPEAEVRPLVNENRISTPSPKPVRRPKPPVCRSSSTAPPRKGTSSAQCHREPSLTTITEEASWHSTTHEIIVEPEFVVETTTCTHPHSTNGSNGSGKSSCSQHSWGQHSDSQNQSAPHITTKVTATAKLKVEVHTPIGIDSCGKVRRSRRMSKDSSSSSDSDFGSRQ